MSDTNKKVVMVDIEVPKKTYFEARKEKLDTLRQLIRPYSTEEILDALIEEFQESIKQKNSFNDAPEMVKKLLGLVYWWNPDYYRVESKLKES